MVISGCHPAGHCKPHVVSYSQFSKSIICAATHAQHNRYFYFFLSMDTTVPFDLRLRFGSRIFVICFGTGSLVIGSVQGSLASCSAQYLCPSAQNLNQSSCPKPKPVVMSETIKKTTICHPCKKHTLNTFAFC